MRLEIPTVPPSLNKTTRRNGFANWRLKNDWILLIRSAMPQIVLHPVVKMRCKVTLAHSRAYDKDNAYGACKPLLDALRHWKLIYDDTAEYLELTVEQIQCPHKQRHTIVELEAL